MKRKLLKSIDSFVNACYMMMKMSVGEFAKENFPKLLENVWNDSKTDSDNLAEFRSMLETNIKLNESVGNPDAAKVISAFRDWISDID